MDALRHGGILHATGRVRLIIYAFFVFALGMLFDGLAGHLAGLFAYPTAMQPGSVVGTSPTFFLLNSALSYLLFSLTVLYLQELREPRRNGATAWTGVVCGVVAAAAAAVTPLLPVNLRVFSAGAAILFGSEAVALCIGRTGLITWTLTSFPAAVRFGVAVAALGLVYEMLNAMIGLWDWRFFSGSLELFELPAIVLFGYLVLSAPYLVLNSTFFGPTGSRSPA